MVRTVAARGSFHYQLGREPHAPSIAACHVADACAAWDLPELILPAHAAAFDLVWGARGPHDLYLTVSLRRRSLLINVRNDGGRVWRATVG